jgi:hypothetical protein
VQIVNNTDASIRAVVVEQASRNTDGVRKQQADSNQWLPHLSSRIVRSIVSQ